MRFTWLELICEWRQAEAAAKEEATLAVPLHLRNAPTLLMKNLNYGDGYLYNPAFACVVFFFFFCAVLVWQQLSWCVW